jgi:hypothetical protein
MPLDKSNGCHDALTQKIDKHNYQSLTPNRKGNKNICHHDTQLSSNDLVISVRKGKNDFLFVPRKKK